MICDVHAHYIPQKFGDFMGDRWGPRGGPKAQVKQGIAAKTQISVTAPCGKVTVFSCGTESRCEVEVDDRQGSHWYSVQYLSADGKVLLQSAPALIDRTPEPNYHITLDTLNQPHAQNP